MKTDVEDVIIVCIIFVIIISVAMAVVLVNNNGTKERDTWVKAKYSLVWDSENLEYVERKGN